MQSDSADLFNLSINNLSRHLSKLPDSNCPEDWCLQLILSSMSYCLKIIFVKFVEKKSLSPDVLEKKELVKFHIFKDEEVEDIGRD